MRPLLILTLIPLFLARAANAAGQPADAGQFWPQWRGPLASGAAPFADPPTTWNETNHIRWKVKLPGEGIATPVIWGDRVFVLTAIPTGRKIESQPATTNAGAGNSGQVQNGQKTPDEVYQFVVLCCDRKTGRTLWQKIAHEQVPSEGHHPDNSYASASPVTDGKYVIASFGSRGLYCYDLEGHLKWWKDFIPARTRMGFGEASSPALYGSTVVLYQDDETDNDFIAALDESTGKILWRTPRKEPTGWSTPLIVEYQGKPQVVVNATTNVCSYDLSTGQEIWSCSGQTANAIPSPVASADTVYVTSGFQGNALYAIALGHAGQLEGTDAIRWTHNKNTPYVPSPLLVDNLLYTITLNNGVLSCFDAGTGAAHFEGEHLEGVAGIYASPVAAHGRVYVLARNGLCLVLQQGPKLEILARNKLDDKTDASIALAGKDLFIRGHQYLYCIGE
jgi:outer membrane protein assembly factor BamB